MYVCWSTALICIVYLDEQFTQLFNALCQQGDKLADLVVSQEWDGLEVVEYLTSRGRGISHRGFSASEIVCDFHGTLRGGKEGHTRYLSMPENAIGDMFELKTKGSTIWVDVTKENASSDHSRCHPNVRFHYLHD